ncbi:MAG: hypothetical protein AB4426_11690 [Xenococcaceae cyanobacterium]
MFAVEFQANIQNGMIEIPEPYITELENCQNVKVIILKNEVKPKIDMIEYLLDNPIEVDNLVPLKRDAIYERK